MQTIKTIFGHLILKIQNFLSKEKSQRKNSKEKCQEKNYGYDKPNKVYIDDDYFYVEGKQYNIVDLEKVEYGHSEIDGGEVKEYYIRLYFYKKINILLHHTPYEVVNINIFIEAMNKFSIPVLPTILLSYPEFVRYFSLTHSFHCSIYERGLLNFWKDKDDIFYLVRYLDGGSYKQINSLDDINLKSFLENPRINLKELDDSYGESFDNAKFRLVVLDKTLTLNRGYGLYPIRNEDIFIEDIFYSFDEEEIKNKIIELFEKHNK